MIKCKAFKDGCDLAESKGIDRYICCFQCSMRGTECNEYCDKEDMSKCSDAVMTDENTQMELFSAKALAVTKAIAELDRQKKDIEAQDSELRKKLTDAMDHYGIKSFDNEYVKITFVEPSTRETLDTKALKADLPEVAKKYMKVSEVKGSVRITVK